MIRYIALLRGINVGGHKIIKMEELAQLFAALKFKEVKTFIQSGNVLFNAPAQSIDSLQQKIEKHLHKSLGYEVTTLLRTPIEFQQIITGNPFAHMPDDEVKKYCVYLIKSIDQQVKIHPKKVQSGSVDKREMKNINEHLYGVTKNKKPFITIMLPTNNKSEAYKKRVEALEKYVVLKVHEIVRKNLTSKMRAKAKP